MSLFEVQRVAKSKAEGKHRFGYFLEMGLGKTMLVLDEFNEMYHDHKVDVLMVFCPNSLIATWRAEVEKHGYPFKVVVKPTSITEVVPPCVVLYNYESIIATAGSKIPTILLTHRTYAAFDESVCIKNHQSQRWKQIVKWQSKFTVIRLLSGRPMVQSPMDLWTQLTLLRGDVSTSPYAYRNTYCKMGGWMNKVVVGAMNEERLRSVMGAVSFTATKKEWTDLPDKLYTDRRYELTKEQQVIYRQMFNDMLVEILGKNISVQQAVHKYSKLQQVGSGFMIDEQGEPTPIMDFNKVPKVMLLDELLEEVSGKTIIFAHYRASVEALSKKYNCPTIRGGMDETDIKAVMDEFNQGDCPVMVAQMAAAKYGLTLLGTQDQPCHTTIYFENSYSLDARLQSEDRNHRWGQKHSVLYIDLIGTEVERKIIAALQRKNDLSKLIMGIIEDEKQRV